MRELLIGVTLKVVEAGNQEYPCRECFFYNDAQGICTDVKCFGKDRRDGKSVVFRIPFKELGRSKCHE